MTGEAPIVSCPHESYISIVRKEVLEIEVEMEVVMIVYRGTCPRCAKEHTRLVHLEGQDPDEDEGGCEDDCCKEVTIEGEQEGI